jgi:membrane protein implicated in regulation of membrane protease activity
MVVIGLVLLAAAIAAAVILIVQNRAAVTDVHALGHTWSTHLYWLVVAGIVLTLVALLGAAIMRRGAQRTRRARRERASLVEENRRLREAPSNPDASPFFGDPEGKGGSAP